MNRSNNLDDAIERVYQAFSKYDSPPKLNFCGFCHDPDQINDFSETPLRKLSSESLRHLAWEASDHWDSTEKYKHYLPAILERLSPPGHGDDLYPEHLFQTLDHYKFQQWDESEKQATMNLFSSMLKELSNSNDDESVDLSIAAIDFIERCSGKVRDTSS